MEHISMRQVPRTPFWLVWERGRFFPTARIRRYRPAPRVVGFGSCATDEPPRFGLGDFDL